MAAARLLYLCILSGCCVFYIACGTWLSWMLLLYVFWLPWVSLMLSIPAIFRFRATPTGPKTLLMGGSGSLLLLGSCSAPMPPFQGLLKLHNTFTGAVTRYNADKGIPSGHCGSYRITLGKGRVYDYLALFSFPIRCREETIVRIYPRPIPVETIAQLPRHLAHSWKPKAGGGFSENHELRSYRPGDPLNQVHWKLSAKTGGLILRESMDPVQGLLLLTMTLSGSPEELDRKLGRLFWLGNHIIRQNMAFELRVLTGAGILTFPIAEDSALLQAMDTLLCSPTAAQGSLRHHQFGAFWHYHIGGEPDDLE